MVSKAHHSASRHITMHQLCFVLQSLFLQKKHAYTCIYIFRPAGPECGPANHRQEENRGSASWRISGASRRITIHPRYHLFYTYFVSSMISSDMPIFKSNACKPPSFGSLAVLVELPSLCVTSRNVAMEHKPTQRRGSRGSAARRAMQCVFCLRTFFALQGIASILNFAPTLISSDILQCPPDSAFLQSNPVLITLSGSAGLDAGMSKIANGGRQALILPTWAALCFPDSDPNIATQRCFGTRQGCSVSCFPELQSSSNLKPQDCLDQQ